MRSVPTSSGYHRSLHSSHPRPHPARALLPGTGWRGPRRAPASAPAAHRGVSAVEKSFFSSPFNKVFFSFLISCLSPPLFLQSHAPLPPQQHQTCSINPAAGQRGTEIGQNRFFTVLFRGRVSCRGDGTLLGTGLAVPYPEIRGEFPVDTSRVCNWEGWGIRARQGTSCARGCP